MPKIRCKKTIKIHILFSFIILISRFLFEIEIHVLNNYDCPSRILSLHNKYKTRFVRKQCNNAVGNFQDDDDVL